MKAAALVLLVALAGCATREYYHISSAEHWSSYGSACSGPVGLFEKQLAPGIRLQLSPERTGDGTYLNFKILSQPGDRVVLKPRLLTVTLSPGMAPEKRILPDGQDKVWKVKIAPSEVDRFQIGFPQLEIDGKDTRIQPVAFEYKTGSYLMCLQ